MRLYEILAIFMAVSVFCLGITYGFDKDMARREYVKAVTNGDYERPIVGCLYKYNCEYYTKLLEK